MFTGRARELEFLDRALDEQSQPGSTVVISAIGGMGGVGKTWLALHWAYRRLDRFPDGQLYVNLRGFDPADQPLPPSAVVRGFLEALGVPPASIPVGHEAQAALYRSLAADRRMLILLDNARDTAQASPLLPGGATCTVLLTSRRRLTGLITSHGAHSVALEALAGDEARELLSRQLGRDRLDAEPKAAAALLSCCAGLPLALSIVAARATTRPNLSLTSLAAELTCDTDHLDVLDVLDAGEPQADLRTVLSWSSRALSADAAHAFGLLGISPGPDIGLSAAASLLGKPTAAVRSVLRELDDAHLIQQHAPDRYRMHDLLRLYATELAHAHHSAENRHAALRRLVDFYVHTATSAARLLDPHRPLRAGEASTTDTAAPLPDAASAMVWFDATHANLLAAQQAAAAHGWHAQVCDLAWALDPYHRGRGHLEDQAATWQRAVSSAEQHLDPAARTRAHQMLGDAYAQLRKTADALHQLRRALALAERSDNIAAQAEIHHSLGGMWERSGDDRKALAHAQRALLIFRRLDDLFQQARALNGVGWLQCRLGEYAEAQAHCEAALALLRKIGNHQLGEANTLDSLGFIAYSRRDYDQALDRYHQALAICRDQSLSYLEAGVLHRIAQILLAQGHSERARDTWRQAHALYTAQHRLSDARRVSQHIADLG